MAMVPGFGTKLAVSKENGLLRIVPPNPDGSSDFVLGPDEVELTKARSIDISIRHDEIIRARVVLCVDANLTQATMDPVLVAPDPTDHYQEKRVVRMEFEDGNVWDEEAC